MTVAIQQHCCSTYITFSIWNRKYWTKCQYSSNSVSVSTIIFVVIKDMPTVGIHNSQLMLKLVKSIHIWHPKYDHHVSVFHFLLKQISCTFLLLCKMDTTPELSLIIMVQFNKSKTLELPWMLCLITQTMFGFSTCLYVIYDSYINYKGLSGIKKWLLCVF